MSETILNTAPPAATTPDTTSTTVTSEAPKSGDGTPIGSQAPGTQTNEPKPEANWRDALPPEYKDDPNLKNFKDLATFAKSHVELRKTLGERIAIPKADAPEPEKQAFFERLGIPKEYDAKVYNVKGPELPSGMELKDEEVSNFAKLGHKLRLAPDQVQGVLNYYGEVVKGMVPNYREDMSKAKEALTEEWGQAIDRNLGLAKRALFADFPRDTVEKIERAGLANDLGFIKSMYQRGKGLVETGVIPTEVAQGMDKRSAETEINTIQGDPKHPYYDKTHPGHAAAVEKVRGLYQLVHG